MKGMEITSLGISNGMISCKILIGEMEFDASILVSKIKTFEKFQEEVKAAMHEKIVRLLNS